MITISAVQSPSWKNYDEATAETVRAVTLNSTGPNISGLIEDVLQIEGPIHQDELRNRCADLTERSFDELQFRARLKELWGLSQVRRDGNYWDSVDTRQRCVRNRSATTSLSLRDPERISPAEIALAVDWVLLENNGQMPLDDLIKSIAVRLGVEARPSGVDEAIEAAIVGRNTCKISKKFQGRMAFSHVFFGI